MQNRKFSDYVDFLRSNINNLIDYKKLAGQYDPKLIKIRDLLFTTDPFKLLDATLAASEQFNKSLYH